MLYLICGVLGAYLRWLESFLNLERNLRKAAIVGFTFGAYSFDLYDEPEFDRPFYQIQR